MEWNPCLTAASVASVFPFCSPHPTPSWLIHSNVSAISASLYSSLSFQEQVIRKWITTESTQAKGWDSSREREKHTQSFLQAAGKGQLCRPPKLGLVTKNHEDRSKCLTAPGSRVKLTLFQEFALTAVLETSVDIWMHSKPLRLGRKCYWHLVGCC